METTLRARLQQGRGTVRNGCVALGVALLAFAAPSASADLVISNVTTPMTPFPYFDQGFGTASPRITDIDPTDLTTFLTASGDTLSFSDPGGRFTESTVITLSGLDNDGGSPYVSVVGSGSLATVPFLTANTISFDLNLLQSGAGSLEFSTTPVPEPNAAFLALVPVLGLGLRRSRKPRHRVA